MQLLGVACVRRDDQNLIHITKRSNRKWLAAAAHPRRVTGVKEIPSAANINSAAGFYVSSTSERAPFPAGVITINTPIRSENLSFFPPLRP